MAAFFGLLAALALAGVTDEQRRYFRQRTRVVRRDTESVPGHVVNHFARGSETWAETNALAVIGTPVSLRLSKLKLIVELKRLNEWSRVKQFIREAGLEDEWGACQYIDTAYPAFVAATNQAVQAGLAADARVKAVIEASIDN